MGFTVGQKLTAAALNALLTPSIFTPSNPNSTTSTTGVMMGLGSTITFTPVFSGNIVILGVGDATVQTGSATVTITGKYGTGTAPVNGAAISGTTWGNQPQLIPSSANASLQVMWSILDKVTGLTLNTAYWIDVELTTSNASDAAAIGRMKWTVQETL